MKRFLKPLLVSVGILLGLLCIAAVIFVLGIRRNQPQMFADPVFDSERPLLVGPFAETSVLVFSKTNGFRHKEAIPAGIEMFRELAEKNSWSAHFTENGAVFNAEQLALFDVVVWNNASGSVLTADQRTAFRNFVENSGGFVALHAAGDGSHKDWPWYAEEVIGAQFTMHTMWPHFQVGTMHIENRAHPATRHLGETWEHEEEWYSFEESARKSGAMVLATVDEATYDPNLWPMGDDHPVVWCRLLGDGRVFYSALGHQAKAYEDLRYRRMLEGAVVWAAGLDE